MTPEQRERHRLYMQKYMKSHPEQRERAATRSRAWAARNPERVRATKAKYKPRSNELRRIQYAKDSTPWDHANLRRSGLTPDQYDEMLINQNGGCWFCGKPPQAVRRSAPLRRLVVDHDHQTGRIRGLLCIGCNISVGKAETGLRSRLAGPRLNAYLNPLIESY